VTSAVRPAKVSLHAADEYGEVDTEVLVGRHNIVVEMDGTSVEFEPPSAQGRVIKLASDTASSPFVARHDGAKVSIAIEGLPINATIRLRIEMPRTDGQLDRAGNLIEAPLYGVVSQLHVALGDAVERGAPVLQMEAMKLIHTLKAPVPGRIEQIRCTVGDIVPAGAILVEITPDEVEEER
jgi:3-methylcrotonyl-CoA carboxylase alpha subunit/geranyl-CoA carboxylase alpha subunit